MEAYESHCPDCGRSYTWVGYKTGIGKTEAQLAQMKKEETTCKHCGSTNLKTGLDHTSEDGRAADAACGMVIDALFGSSKKKPVPRFRKKPVEIEAIQYTGDNFDEIYEWARGDKAASEAPIVCGNKPDGSNDLDALWISTLEGNMKAIKGDWIIKGVKGEFYPCKPDIFKETYEDAN